MNGNLITDDIRTYAKCLRLSNFAQNCSDYFHKAQIDKPTYQDFILNVLKTEVEERQKRELQRRIKKAKLPRSSNLDSFDFNHSAGITRMQLGQLRELAWLDQMYNIILMGPSGTGKTYITGGLIRDAVLKGYKAQFIPMDQLVEILRMKDVSTSAMSAYKHLTKCNLVGIDDIMLMPMKKEEAVAFFNLVNLACHHHEQSTHGMGGDPAGRGSGNGTPRPHPLSLRHHQAHRLLLPYGEPQWLP